MCRFIRLQIVALLTLVTLLAGRIDAQDYPFFVQPLSVDDLQTIADAVELSPEQRLEMLEAHSNYLDDLESLQSGPMKRFMDQGIGMVTEVQPWSGNFSIPPRRDIQQMIRDGRGVFDSFGGLDDNFFDAIAPLVSEAQLPRMELARTVRALERYRLVYLMIAGEVNRTAGVNLIAYLIRNEARLTPEMVDVLLDHQERLITRTQALERAALAAIDSLLDKVDEMGLRDMDQEQMMMLAMDENLRNELMVWVDDLSRPLQVTVAGIAQENLRAWRELEPLLDEDLARDVSRRVERRAWGRLCRGLHRHESRFDEVIDHLDEQDPRRADAIDGQTRLRDAKASLIAEYAPIVAKQRRYRSLAQFRDDDSMEGADRIEAIMERKAQVEAQAESLLVVLEADMPDDDDEAQTVVASQGGGGADASGNPLQLVGDEDLDLPLQPVTVDQLDQMLGWIDAPESAQILAQLLHEDYVEQCRELSTSHKAALSAIPSPEGRSGWREQRRAIRALDAETIESLSGHEDALFKGLEVAMDDEAVRNRMARIRTALERSRQRTALYNSDWSMRSQPEAMIDLTTLVLGESPDALSADDRSRVLQHLADYDEAISGTLEELEEMLERVQLLESRLNGPDNDEFDPEVRGRIRSSWQQRRAAVGALSADLVEINRDRIRALSSALPGHDGAMLMETYRRSAFPDLFRDQEVISAAFEEALSLETLGDEQRRRLQDLRMRHSTTWGALTDELISLRSEGDVRPSSWPPSSESMNLALRNEQLRFRRGQVAQRHLAELVVLLQPEQRAMVPSLEQAL